MKFLRKFFFFALLSGVALVAYGGFAFSAQASITTKAETAVGSFFLETDFEFPSLRPRVAAWREAIQNIIKQHSNILQNVRMLLPDISEFSYAVPDSLRVISSRASSQTASLWDSIKNILRFPLRYIPKNAPAKNQETPVSPPPAF